MSGVFDTDFTFEQLLEAADAATEDSDAQAAARDRAVERTDSPRTCMSCLGTGVEYADAQSGPERCCVCKGRRVL